MQVQLAMQRRDSLVREWMDGRKLQKVDVKVNDIEFMGALADLLQHDHVVREGVLHLGVQPKSHAGAGYEFSSRLRIATGEKRDLVALLHEFFG